MQSVALRGGGWWKDSPWLHVPRSRRVGVSQQQLREETSEWWPPGEIAQSRSVGKAGDDATLTPRHQKYLEI